MVTIRNEQAADAQAIEQLLDIAFEPSRHGRPSYRLREGVAKRDDLSLVAEVDSKLVGGVRFWPILIGDNPALLLGPIAVHPDHEGHGIGSRLVSAGLDAAKAAGFRLVIAVGAKAYLGRFGFKPASPLGFVFPVPVDDERFLVTELAAGALSGAAGVIRSARGASDKRPKRRVG
ncbi:MAG: N-acetyltransferase [Alphaproteobacteria bacterium]|nr:N-acetyltransferase [Alphaproteobacteria bacterium]